MIRIPAAMKYPADALKNHLEGTLVLRVKVGRDGKVLKVEPLPGKAYASRVAAVVSTTSQWRFSPTVDANGAPTSAWVRVPIKFAMDPPHAKNWRGTNTRARKGRAGRTCAAFCMLA
jgi:TonB family protein